MTKEQAIKRIAGRIRDEYQKHSHSIEEWPEIAASKLYMLVRAQGGIPKEELWKEFEHWMLAYVGSDGSIYPDMKTIYQWFMERMQPRQAAITPALQPNGLLPCPFCGGEAVARHYGNGLTVSCKKCFMGTMLYMPQEAIDKWNKRQ